MHQEGEAATLNNFGDKVAFIWSVADLLRGPYRPNQYKDVMLPMTVLRRLDCVLEPTKSRVLERMAQLEGGKVKHLEPILCRVAGLPFCNTSRYTFERLKADSDNIAANLTAYIKGFSTRAREIIENFGFEEHITKLDKNERLFLLVSKFCEIDLHPDSVSNIEMGYIFEELIRRFNEASNEEAGDHFTPREVIRLMVDLIFLPDNDTLTTAGLVRTLYDPACGTGGMLSVSEEYLREHNPDATLEVFGQDYNAQAHAICGSDMMIKGQNIDHIAFGDSFTNDHFPAYRFDYMLANPPFGVEWKPQESHIRREHEEQGFGGRFGAGLPRINDGSFLFLQHMTSKMKDPKEGGTRLAIVFNGSPLFTGSAGSGESEIRRWIIENDWLEGIVALPEQLFYNTGILTYLWIVTNRKEPRRRGKIQLVDATSFFKKMRKSLGNKRHEVCEDQRAEIVRLYGDLQEGEHVRIFENSDFGYRRVTIERPLRLNFAVTQERMEAVQQSSAFTNLATTKKRKDSGGAATDIAEGEMLQKRIIAALSGLATNDVVKNRETFAQLLRSAFRKAGINVPAPLFKATLTALSERDETADVCLDGSGKPEPDPELRDYENVPLNEDVVEYMQREVLPHVPDAWVDESKTKVGYEINFNRYFYRYTPPRPLEEIEADLKQIEREIAEMVSAAIITHAVTKGLNPDVRMKDSGVEWLGEIPEHWRMLPLKRVVSIREGQVDPKLSEFSDLPLIAPNHIQSRTGRLLEIVSTGEQEAISGKYPFSGGEILYSKIRPALAKACIAPTDGLCSADMYPMRTRPGFVSAYVVFALISEAFTALTVNESMRVAMPKINRERLGELRFAYPPEDEQSAIVQRLANVIAPIDHATKHIQASLSLLQEYRTALISAAVTGKIDVRGEAS